MFIHDHSKNFIEAFSLQQSRKSSVHRAKLETYSKTSSELHQQLEPTLQHAVELASVKEASNWLTTLSLNEHGFALHKSAFQDALVLRYGCMASLCTPTLCACGASFSVDHVLSCLKGGLPSLRHNEIRDLTATLLTEVCSQVCIEPELQPIHNPDEFHLSTSNTGIAMNGCWGSHSERCFIDVHVFNPLAPSNSSSLLSSTFKKHENIKHRAYGQRIREVEHTYFTPIVMSATGGLAHGATVFYKHLASLLSAKWCDEYSLVLGWLWFCVGFSLLCSAIQCIRGACSSIGAYTRALLPMGLVQVESHLSE